MTEEIQKRQEIYDTIKVHRPLSENAERTHPPGNPPADEEDVRKGGLPGGCVRSAFSLKGRCTLIVS